MGVWIKFGSAVAFASLFGLMAYVIETKGVASQEAAGWAQAVGTVAAIAGTAYAASRGSTEAREKEERDRAHALKIASVVALHAHVASRQAQIRAAEIENWEVYVPAEQFSSEHLRDSVRALSELSLTNLPAQFVPIACLMTLRRTLIELLEVVEHTKPFAGGAVSSEISRLHETATIAVQDVVRAAGKLDHVSVPSLDD